MGPETKFTYALIDPPSAFDTLESWGRHLRDVIRLPSNFAGKGAILKDARYWVERKRAEAAEKA